ncbi:hypothetical protein KQX54_021559 [Cotesia glomerata]|uniref:Uncharacterized protein n=1 Tax=Cotesia glomerata TaxID=32391 RepID=A0AAV7IWE1_COTGL|nr:hypothetical protein KQX54_021559 [Cotesia glomerata]
MTTDFFPLQSLPQTPAGGVGGKGLGSGCGAGTGPGMVNGAAVDHQDIRDGVAINTEHSPEVFVRLNIHRVVTSIPEITYNTRCDFMSFANRHLPFAFVLTSYLH